MKKLHTTLPVAFMLLASSFTAMSQVTRPGQSSSTTTRPGVTNVRPSTGVNHNKKPSKPSSKPGHNTSVRPGSTKPTRPGSNTPVRPGNTTATRPGTINRPVTVVPPSRPNRLPATLRPIPTRPGTLRPGSRVLVNSIFGISFGSSLTNSLNYLYNSNYSVDGYGTNEVYLRNVTEFNYTWTDATLIYQNGILAQSVMYESTISDNTSRYYGVYNRIRSMYGNPATSSTNGRNLTATWWGTAGEYISLEYSLQKSTAGYRYFTILTIGR